MGSLKIERIDSTTQLLANQSLRSVQTRFCFLTDKAFPLAFPSCLWAFFLNLGPGLIACTTGVICFRVFEASKERVPRPFVSGSPRSLPTCLHSPKKPEKRSLVMQATGVKKIGPILLVSKRPRNRILGGRSGVALLPRV